MKAENIFIGCIIGLVVAFVTAMVYDAIDDVNHRDIESQIELKLHYDSESNKKAAVDECMKILKTNNYTLCKAGVEKHGLKRYVVIKGAKYKAADGK